MKDKEPIKKNYIPKTLTELLKEEVEEEEERRPVSKKLMLYVRRKV